MNLFDLVAKSDVAAIKQGLWSRAELDAKDHEGMTALMRAALKGDCRVVAVLKDLGADVDITDGNGRKAVDLAALHGHGNVMIYLIKGGCGG